MLKPAQLYQDELNKKYINTWYDDRYMYYRSYGTGIIELPKDNYDNHHFVSVDDNDDIIGYMSYHINWNIKTANAFGIISFDIGNVMFLRDIKRATDDIFYKYNLNRIEWFCVADNPAIKGYRKFIKRHGGRECGYLRETALLSDGKLHDDVFFEILKCEYKE
ncbi:MAG: GNAT family protein [Clostridia bacterium]|nr:GNAT family protein [Clostridia bacterium]